VDRRLSPIVLFVAANRWRIRREGKNSTADR